MQYAAADIDLFHVEMRSIFDYIARALVEVSNSSGKVIDGSFEKLRKWIDKKPDNERRLGEEAARSVRSCDWFEEMRAVRDSIVHRGGVTFVFPEKGRILFQVSKGYEDKISLKKVMANENVADFELYAGLYIGYLITYLEEVAELIHSRLGISESESNPKSYHLGLRVVNEWIKRALSLPAANNTEQTN